MKDNLVVHPLNEAVGNHILSLESELSKANEQLSNQSRLLDMAEEKLKNVHACFVGAESEGLLESLREADTTPGMLGDLVERRLMFADDYALSGLAAIQEGRNDDR